MPLRVAVNVRGWVSVIVVFISAILIDLIFCSGRETNLAPSASKSDVLTTELPEATLKLITWF